MRLIRVPLTGHSLHIDGCIIMVAQDLALINVVRLPYWFLDLLKDLKIRYVDIHHGDNPMVINCLAVKPGGLPG